MRKYILGLIGVIGVIGVMGCSENNKKQDTNTMDSIIVRDLDKDLIFTSDSFKLIKDSFVYINDSYVYADCSGFWCTKEFYKWNFEFPDTIKVAFTKDGEFIDSFEAIRQGVLMDKNGKEYSPEYVFTSMVGDRWSYDVNGKFIKFTESPCPHSGKGEMYKP